MEDLKRPLFNTMPELDKSSLNFRILIKTVGSNLLFTPAYCEDLSDFHREFPFPQKKRTVKIADAFWIS